MNGAQARLHHVGCLVPGIEAAVENYSALGYKISGITGGNIASQKVRVCFLEGCGDTLIELIQPNEDNRLLRRWLDKGISFYHVGYLCPDMESKLKLMTDQGAHILTRFASESFPGQECVFVVTPQGQMIELIQAMASRDSHAA